MANNVTHLKYIPQSRKCFFELINIIWSSSLTDHGRNTKENSNIKKFLKSRRAFILFFLRTI